MTRGPIPLGVPHFDTAVIKSEDPVTFARELKDALNKFVKEGFQLQSMMERPPHALVITACKNDLLPTPATASKLPDDVVYTFLENDVQKQLHFRSVSEAVDMVAEHMKNEEILPFDITEVRITRHNPLDLISTPRPSRRVD